MADRKISELDVADPLVGDELVPVVQSGDNKAVAAADVAALALATQVDKEVPAGDIDGVNDTFVLSDEPVAGSEYVFVDGVLKADPADYSLAADTLTFVAPPAPGSALVVSFRKAL